MTWLVGNNWLDEPCIPKVHRINLFVPQFSSFGPKSKCLQLEEDLRSQVEEHHEVSMSYAAVSPLLTTTHHACLALVVSVASHSSSPQVGGSNG